MSHSHIQDVTEQTFDAEVLRAEGPVLVDFTAAWCGPCRALAPVLDSLAAEEKGRVTIRTVDSDRWTELAARYKVKAMPTIIAFSAGREVARHIGLTTKEKLRRMVDQAR